MRRGRRGAPRQGAPEAVGIDALPPDLLCAVLCAVPADERHRSAALVCRQWAQLVHSPSLLRCLSVSVAVRGDFFVGLPHEAAVAQMADLQRKQRRFMERLRSLCVWLVQRAAGHVQQLELCLTAPDLRQADRAADHLEAAGMLAAALAAQASTLERLHLATHCLVLPTLGVWLAPLTRLTHLFLSSGSEELAIRGPLHLAHSLQSLHLGGLPVLEPTVELPLGLTRLSMYFGSSEHPLPAQMGLLHFLRELKFDFCCFKPDHFEALAGLALHGTLTRLAMYDCESVPCCLGALTSLRSLTITDNQEDTLKESDADILELALPKLQQLTLLHLDSGHGLPRSMAPLSSLCHLQAVFWHGGLDWGRHVLAPGASAALALPDGPWCDGLQRLVVSCSRLVGPSSLRVLSAAQQLELLGVAGIDNVQRDRRINAALKKVAAWAQQHANLRRLMLDVELEAEWPLAAAAFTATQRKRPQLCIQSFMDDIAFGAACGFNSKFACA